MTKIALTALVLLFCQSGMVLADSETKICEKLYSQAEENCTEAMCEEFGDEECPMDGDFHEGLQICVTEGELESVIKAYNLKHPRKKVKCEDF